MEHELKNSSQILKKKKKKIRHHLIAQYTAKSYCSHVKLIKCIINYDERYFIDYLFITCACICDVCKQLNNDILLGNGN
jgi:hypothetical protein